jgi:aspartyl-tRNA(Asn)/glutamyl-tRNA(Gln) amidotransferase subunit B
VQETRGWDEASGRTVVQRSKEEANDYRYFPEPDLPPLRPSPAWVAELSARLPELPAQRRARYTDAFDLSAYDAGVLTSDAALAAYFDAVVDSGVAPKIAANWVTGEFSRLLNQHAASGLRADRVALHPAGLAELIGEVDAGRVSAASAKAVLASVFETGESPRGVIERDGLAQVSDASAIGAEIEAVLAEHPEQVAEYRSGKTQVMRFLVGQVMRRMAGRADAHLVNDELRRRLDAGDGG